MKNYHRITEFLELEETLKIIQFQSPAMGRIANDNFNIIA